MNIKYLFCKAIERIMDAIKEGKSVTQIIADVGVQKLPEMDRNNTDKALIKLSEKVLQMNGSTDVVVLEELSSIDDEESVGMSAFIDTIEKTSFTSFEVVSLLETDDLNIEQDIKRRRVTQSLNERLTPFKITETQDEHQSKELVLEKQPKTRAVSSNQAEEQIQPKVFTILFMIIRASRIIVRSLFHEFTIMVYYRLMKNALFL